MDDAIHSLESDPIDANTLKKVKEWKLSGKDAGLTQAQQEKFKYASVMKHPQLGNVLVMKGRIIVDYPTAEALIIKSWKDPTMGYQSAEKLWSKLKETFLGVSRRHTMAVVARFQANQLIGPKYSHTPVKPIQVSKPMKYLQADLIDRQAYADTNRKFAYLLTVIDVFSKFAFAIPIHDKTVESIKSGIQKVLDTVGEGIVKVFHTDNGSEFKNAQIAAFLKEHGIKQVHGQAYRYQSQGTVERFNQTLQMMIHRYLLQNETNSYVDVLDTLVKNYNSTVHESTKQRPIDLIQPITDEVRAKLKGAKASLKTKAERILLKQSREFPDIAVGDYVRVIQLKFQKKKVKIHDVKYRTDIYQVVGKRYFGNDFAYKITSNLEDKTAGPFETVSRFQIKKIPAPSMLIVPEKKRAEPKLKLIAEKVHKPRKELPDAPELRRSARVPTVQKALAAGETKKGKSDRVAAK